MTPVGSVLITSYTQRALAHEAKGDYASARQDYATALEGQGADAGSKANQATAKTGYLAIVGCNRHLAPGKKNSG